MCPLCDVKELRIAHNTALKRKLSRIQTLFVNKAKNCFVCTMTTKHIFEFIQRVFKGFRKTKRGIALLSRRDGRNSLIEVKTWKSPKLKPTFSQAFFMSPSAKWVLLLKRTFCICWSLRNTLCVADLLLFVMLFSHSEMVSDTQYRRILHNGMQQCSPGQLMHTYALHSPGWQRLKAFGQEVLTAAGKKKKSS